MITIIDYGSGNLNSVSKAFELSGSNVRISNNYKTIIRSQKIVLPGVGSFKDAIKNLKKLTIFNLIKHCINDGIPYFGICLGLQILFEESEEGNYPGLSIFKGKIKYLKNRVKVPHMGWNTVKFSYKIDIFNGIKDNSYFYFAHSYHAVPSEKKIVAGTTDYYGNFVSCISYKNIFATQFHPEKSGETGLKLIYNFIKI